MPRRSPPKPEREEKSERGQYDARHQDQGEQDAILGPRRCGPRRGGRLPGGRLPAALLLLQAHLAQLAAVAGTGKPFLGSRGKSE